MPPELTVDIERLPDGAHIVAPAGEIDIHSAASLERAVAKALGETEHGLIFDLTGVSFMDSTAINILLVARKRLVSRGGRLAVICPDQTLCRVFDALAIRELLDVTDTREEALARLRS